MRSSSSCRLNPILAAIGDHWTLGIIHELSAGPRRTLDLFGAFTGLSTKTLTSRLKMMRRSGLVERKSFPETPPRVEYSLTDKGREVLPVLKALGEVAHKWNGEPADAGLAPCQACRIEYPAGGEATSGQSPARPEHEPPPPEDPSTASTSGPRPRKRSDVTLL
ncbi:MAG TPA: helix-turn-helix domain-containing protein [Blastocatellia bacterium]|jgi:DNA-binding HxlR family transcriptional regulator|nr:helix-turn-helix domain-containing protein [Blastocatellia bacterium]